jgi:hypothetical protein
VLEFRDERFHFLAIKAAGGDAVKPYPLVEDLVRPVLRVAMPRAPRQGPAGRRQLAAGRGNSRTIEYPNCRTVLERERNDRFRQRTIREKNGRVLQTERRSPGRCPRSPRSPLDHPAPHRKPGLRSPFRPAPGAAKYWNHARAESRGLRLNGVRHLFPVEDAERRGRV